MNGVHINHKYYRNRSLSGAKRFDFFIFASVNFTKAKKKQQQENQLKWNRCDTNRLIIFRFWGRLIKINFNKYEPSVRSTPPALASHPSHSIYCQQCIDNQNVLLLFTSSSLRAIWVDCDNVLYDWHTIQLDNLYININ